MGKVKHYPGFCWTLFMDDITIASHKMFSTWKINYQMKIWYFQWSLTSTKYNKSTFITRRSYSKMLHEGHLGEDCIIIQNTGYFSFKDVSRDAYFVESKSSLRPVDLVSSRVLVRILLGRTRVRVWVQLISSPSPGVWGSIPNSNPK